MFSYSSSGEVFGSKVLYGAMVAMSVVLLLASVSRLAPAAPDSQTRTSVGQVAETVVVTAKSGKAS